MQGVAGEEVIVDGGIHDAPNFNVFLCRVKAYFQGALWMPYLAFLLKANSCFFSLFCLVLLAIHITIHI